MSIYRRLFYLFLGLAFVTAGSAGLFYGVLLGWPGSLAAWTLRVLYISWGAILASVGFETLTFAGDPDA